MNINDLVAALSARAKEIDDWSFNVEATVDEDGDGEVILSIGYDEKYEYTDEPWNAFGSLPIESSASGMDGDQGNTVYQWVSWKIIDGAVA